jgi:anti-sigma factor RsiW
MNRLPCEAVRDVLLEWKAGLLQREEAEVVEVHLAGCGECREEMGVLDALLLARPEPPEGLEARIQAAVRHEWLRGARREGEGRVLTIPRGRRWIPVWALSAAAVVLLALGARMILGPDLPDGTQDPLLVALQEPLPEKWLWADGMVAGAPVFDDLSDEELEALVKALEGG